MLTQIWKNNCREGKKSILIVIYSPDLLLRTSVCTMATQKLKISAQVNMKAS